MPVPPDGLVLLGYRGSIAHGMHNPDPNSIDDIDLIGAIIAPKNCYLGLAQWGSRGTKEIKEGRYDCVYYEISKLVRLLLQGNPNVLSLLWLHNQHYLFKKQPFADILIENRGRFVGKHVYAPFAGYAAAQMKKMESRDPAELREYLFITAELKARGQHPNHKGKFFDRPDDLFCAEPAYLDWSYEKLIQRLRHYQKKGENIGYMGEKRKRLVLERGFDCKNAAHLIRLLRMCKEFLQDGAMQVYRHKDAAELMDIKNGKWTLDDVKAHAEELFAECREAKDKSELPDGPDREAVEEMLMTMLSVALDTAPEQAHS